MLLLAALLPGPAARAQVAGPAVEIWPDCVRQGATARIQIVGFRWALGSPVQLFHNGTAIGTGTVRSTQSGTGFTFVAEVPATGLFVVTAQQGRFQAVDRVQVSTVPCPGQVTVAPTCLRAKGDVQVSGSGFGPGSVVQVYADLFGPAEAQVSMDASEQGTFSIAVPVGFSGGTVPIAVVGLLRGDEFPTRFVAFVDPCPPPPTTTTTTTRPAPVRTTTTTATTQPVTTTTIASTPPQIPPAQVPTQGATAAVSISPRTVRPGRCAVIVIAAAPPGLPVVVRFADGPPVTSQVGPAGGTVASVCHPHDSGLRLGPVQVLLAIGAVEPIPVFTVLRVPARPQPPLLQAGADGRRS